LLSLSYLHVAQVVHVDIVQGGAEVNTNQGAVRRIVAALAQSKHVAAKLALVLFVSVFQPFMPVEEQPAGLSPDAPAYAVHGPYVVGYRSLAIGDETEQPLALSARYSALSSTGAEEELSCHMEIKDAK
jgi:hypothetical protein